MAGANHVSKLEPAGMGYLPAQEVSLDVLAPHGALAEMLVHRALLEVDPTARHIGGNRAIRDHELLGNSAWCNTKAGWFDRLGWLGFSAVNWSRARDLERPKRSLDLVAIVPLRPESIRTRWTLNGIAYAWDSIDWYLVPASILHEHHVSQSKVRQAVPLDVVNEFIVTKSKRLDRERLTHILERNDVLEGASPYEFHG